MIYYTIVKAMYTNVARYELSLHTLMGKAEFIFTRRGQAPLMPDSGTPESFYTPGQEKVKQDNGNSNFWMVYQYIQYIHILGNMVEKRITVQVFHIGQYIVEHFLMGRWAVVTWALPRGSTAD